MATEYQLAVEEAVYNGFGGLNQPGLQVLRSAAGYYLGELYYDPDFEHWMPWCRDSDYFPTRLLAELALRTGNWIPRGGA